MAIVHSRGAVASVAVPSGRVGRQLALINNRTLLPSAAHLHCSQSHELAPRRSQLSPFSGWKNPYFQLLASPREQRVVHAEAGATTTRFDPLGVRNKCTEELKEVVERRVQAGSSALQPSQGDPACLPEPKKKKKKNQIASRATFKMCSFDPSDRARSV